MAAPVYSIDTNSLMDWQARFYPTDVFASLVDRMQALVASGQLVAAELVYEETGAVGSAGLIEWTRKQKGMFVPTADLLTNALVIQNQFPGLRDPKAEFEEADAYVIALARQRDGVVVTQETSAAEKTRPRRSHFIPDVCRELGIPCISLLGMMRKEAWTF